MNYGPDKIVACPLCQGIGSHQTLMSGNTFGARVWTDGKQIAPMYFRPPAVVKCQHCAGFYWLADAREMDEDDLEHSAGPAWYELDYLAEPTEDEYYLAIEQGLARDREKERILRTLAWWRGNDAFREHAGGKNGAAMPHPAAYWSNLKALAGLLGEGENDLVMKAEALRELGLFEEAVEILGRVTSDDYAAAVGQLRALCEAKDAGLKELQFDD